MKIAHVVARFPPDVGGMGAVAWQEAQSLAKLGHQVTVFSLPPKTIDQVGGNFQHEILLPLIPGGDAGWVPSLLGKLRGFDIVHLHYPFYGGAEWVWLAKLLHKQKYIVTYHMQARPTSTIKTFVQMICDVLLMPAILENAEKVLLVDRNYFENNEFLKKMLSERVVDLPNGIDTSLFCPNVGVENFQPQPRELLFVGNLMPVKGLDILLQTLNELPGAKLTVVGAGYEEVVYQKMTVDLGLSDRVTFVGSVPHHELPKYYCKAWATIVPSRAESFSLVTLESMACGTPVVASDVVGIRGKIENGVDGYYFEKENVKDLKINIETVMRLSTDERKIMGESGSVKVKETFSLESHVQNLVRIYSEII